MDKSRFSADVNREPCGNQVAAGSFSDREMWTHESAVHEVLLLCKMLDVWVCLAEGIRGRKVESRCCPARGSGQFSKRPVMAISGVCLGLGPKTGQWGKGLEWGIFVFYFFIVVLHQRLFF